LPVETLADASGIEEAELRELVSFRDELVKILACDAQPDS